MGEPTMPFIGSWREGSRQEVGAHAEARWNSIKALVRRLLRASRAPGERKLGGGAVPGDETEVVCSGSWMTRVGRRGVG
jgi:hypothetical protein